MCGIGAIFYAKPQKAETLISELLEMQQSMAHRGPDDAGIALVDESGSIHNFKINDTLSNCTLPDISNFSGNCLGGLVHRRLSIINPGASGHQPMVSEKIGMVYNGEIYNYRELDFQNNYQNISATDSETMFQLLSNPEFDSIQEIDGFFAYIKWDKDTKTLSWATDGNQVKPLFHYTNGNKIWLCSEMRTLEKLSGISITVDTNYYLCYGKYFFLNFGYKQQLYDRDNMYYQQFNFNYAPDAEGIEITENKIKKPIQKKITFDENYFAESIRRRLISDVPIGFSLSGGLDSSLVAAQAKKLLAPDAKMHCFSVVSSHPQSNERNFQKTVIDHIQADWHTVNIDDLNVSDIEAFIAHTGFPPVGWNNLAHKKLCELAKSHGVNVLFNGQGADELFVGYPYYLYRIFGKYFFYFFKYRKHLAQSYAQFAKQFVFLTLKRCLNRFGIKVIPYKKYLKIQNFQSVFTENNFLHANLNQLMQMDFYALNLPQMLFLEDLNGMACQIENRNPFADDMPLAQSVYKHFNLSENLDRGYSKGKLRNIARKILPLSIANRTDKKGFSVPDAELTRKNYAALRPYFLGATLNEIIPLKKRENMDAKFSTLSEKDLQLVFRLSCLAMYHTLHPNA